MDSRIEFTEGDITRQTVDAIVNAANQSLLGGGGVDGAIHRAAGPRLRRECEALGGCPTGEARLTGGHDLAARWVIHTVGPIWQGGGAGERAQLAACYRNSLSLTEEVGARSIAFPSISTGAFGFPMEPATDIALETVSAHLAESSGLARVVFVCFGRDAYECYAKRMETRGIYDCPFRNPRSPARL